MSADLIGRLLDGALEGSELDAFEAAWRDPAQRADILAHARLDAALRRLARADAAVRDAVLASLQAASSGRLKKDVMATLGRRRRTALAALIGAAAALVLWATYAVASSWSTMPSRQQLIVRLAADAFVSRGHDRLPLLPGAELRAGDRVDAIGLTIAWDDGTTATFRDTAFMVADPSRRLSIASGSVAASVESRPRDPLLFETPRGVARVVGTDLLLAVDARRTLLDVAHGLVRLEQPSGASADVGAGGWARLDAAGMQDGAVAARPGPSLAPEAPRDDPVAARYGHDHGWVAAFPWTRVFDARDARAPDDRRRIALAIDAAVAAGGGVVWLAPGTWRVDRDIELPAGVVLRGSGHASLLVFPDRAGAGIINADARARDLGIVDLAIDGGSIRLLPELEGHDGAFDGWRRASGVVGMGARKLVVGVALRHATQPLGEGLAWPHPFSTAVAVYSDEHALVADNDLLPATRRVDVGLDLARAAGGRFTATVPYPYDERYGIDVNRLMLGGIAGSRHGAQAAAGAIEPSQFPWWFRRGLAIRDNRVHCAGRVGISWSGGGDGATAGSGTLVTGNAVEIAAASIAYSTDGRTLRNPSSSNENRCYDQCGHASLVACNRGIARRQRTVDPGFTGDGEALLHRALTSARLAIWRDNDFTGGQPCLVAYQGVAQVSDCQVIGNRAPSGSTIGGTRVRLARGNTVHGNDPRAIGLDD
ncbi:MAG TPA: hypothetical protein VEL07_05965 [Planctomycetota bacterium]|nr:hypothetical protein [Planctomycetota bacterium]